MKDTEHLTEYERLRGELEAAYAAPVWNSALIDRIANALARLEWASIRRSTLSGSLVGARQNGLRELDMSRA